MITFNYLRSARPAFVRRFLDIRIPPELKGPLFAVTAAVVIVGVAWMIEGYRLSVTLGVENIYQTRYSETRLELARKKILFSVLGRIAGLAREVRAIQTSGDEEARQFADIGNRLPPHVWLTAIANDGKGISLSGKAADLNALSHTVSGLSRTSAGYLATLVSASGDERGIKPGTLHYELRLESSAL